MSPGIGRTAAAGNVPARRVPELIAGSCGGLESPWSSTECSCCGGAAGWLALALAPCCLCCTAAAGDAGEPVQ